MTAPRSELVDIGLTRYYHCISRCVRQAFLCGEGYDHRKQWLEERLELLAQNFAISVCSFSAMDNHLHVLVRLDGDIEPRWSNQGVIRRWIAVYPPSKLDLNNPKAVQAWVEKEAKNRRKVAEYRKRLQNLGWFMKALKEPLARMANKEDGCRGAFFEGRYKSIAILDDEVLLATAVYVDLNPLAAGMATTPESSPHTSIRQRILNIRMKGELAALKAASLSSALGSIAAGKIEESHWLCPIEDLRRKGSQREGMLDSFSLGSYLLLVDATSRMVRTGKARVSHEVAGILDRLGTSSQLWEARLKKLFAKERLLGSYFATRPDRLQTACALRGVHHVDNTVRVVS